MQETEQLRHRCALRGTRASVAGSVLACALSQICCFAQVPHALPQHPLCVVAETQQHLLGRLGKITPEPVSSVLFVPYFAVGNSEPFVACPFVYRPGDEVVIPKASLPRIGQYDGAIVLCGGYFPTRCPMVFIDTDIVNGKKCQLVEVARVRSDEEAVYVLDAWGAILNSDSFSITKPFDALEHAAHRKDSYATGAEFISPVERQYRQSYTLWPYEIGTVVKVRLTRGEKKTVQAFIREEKEKLLSRKSLRDDMSLKTDTSPQEEQGAKSPPEDAGPRAR